MSQTTTRFTHPVDEVQPLAASKHHDAAVFDAPGDALQRRQRQIELIASENVVSEAVLAAQGLVLTSKDAAAADASIEARVRAEVIQLCERFPIYSRLTPVASATIEGLA